MHKPFVRTDNDHICFGESIQSYIEIILLEFFPLFNSVGSTKIFDFSLSTTYEKIIYEQ